MKIEKKVWSSTDVFGNLDVGDVFEYEGNLYLKVLTSGYSDNAYTIGMTRAPSTFMSDVKVQPVVTLTYSLE